jgi:hypothetical protein
MHSIFLQLLCFHTSYTAQSIKSSLSAEPHIMALYLMSPHVSLEHLRDPINECLGYSMSGK